MPPFRPASSTLYDDDGDGEWNQRSDHRYHLGGVEGMEPDAEDTHYR